MLNSLRSPKSQLGYRHSIDEFAGWYYSEARLSFSKTVVSRYRVHLPARWPLQGRTRWWTRLVVAFGAV